jgi:hypothetical protein
MELADSRPADAKHDTWTAARGHQLLSGVTSPQGTKTLFMTLGGLAPDLYSRSF